MPITPDDIPALQARVDSALLEFVVHHLRLGERYEPARNANTPAAKLETLVKELDLQVTESRYLETQFRIALMQLYFAKREKDLMATPISGQANTLAAESAQA
jgi:hypothetical protein